ncbi:MAG: endolytic transglycosylase MltG [Venatoribacter sp.]
MVLAIGLFLAGRWYWFLPLGNQAPRVITISSGETLSSKATQWQQQGWLPSARLLRLQARIYGFSYLRAGEFELPANLTGPQFLRFLQEATPLLHRLTLIEGRSLQDTLAFLATDSRLTQDIQPLTQENVATALNLTGSPEGLFYPDTYSFQRGDKVSVVLKQAHQRLNQELTKAWEQRASNLPYQTPYQALIMASIVEKETAVAFERPIIAGVFVRRLQKKMRLETDPTVIYGLGEAFHGNLTRQHLRDGSNPWNTYRHFGLPPTPIAAAGRLAIEAALHPADGDELFFVAKGDGTHYFSATLAEHNKAVRQYQIKNRASNYRSSPIIKE